MVYEHFRAAGAHEAALDVSDPLNASLQGDDIKDFDARWESSYTICKSNTQGPNPGKFVQDENT